MASPDVMDYEGVEQDLYDAAEVVHLTTHKTSATLSTMTKTATPSSAPPPANKTLQELYAQLEKTQPGSKESRAISEKIIEAIG